MKSLCLSLNLENHIDAHKIAPKVTEIYIVYQQGGSYGDSFVREVKAFRSKVKAEQFEKDCKDAALCLSMALHELREKQRVIRQPYTDLFRQRKATPAQVKEYTEITVKLIEVERDLIKSNTFDPSWDIQPCSDYYINTIELVE